MKRNAWLAGLAAVAWAGLAEAGSVGFETASAPVPGDKPLALTIWYPTDAPERPTPLPTLYAPEPGRRFGIALALVILLILFTLALSIVLRPRHRDAPIELSSLVPTCPLDPNTTMLSSCAVSPLAKRTASSRC